jgi:hypothetical protein
MTGFPNGHFYSPVIDAEDLRKREEQIWPPQHSPPLGIDLDLEGQHDLLEQARPFAVDYRYPGSGSERVNPYDFQDGNGFFENLDSRMLYSMLRIRSPHRMVEVGCGHSSLLSADVNRRHLALGTEITCIEPYPPDFLSEEIPGISRLIPERVESVGLGPFLELQQGDFLFIDSSHVSKTGSDVNFLYLEVIPRLAEGVIIHIHDIFIPEDYPRAWVLGEERSWNEQYLLQALLMYSSGFRVLFGSNCATCFFPDRVESVFGGHYGGGSFWIEKLGARNPQR